MFLGWQVTEGKIVKGCEPPYVLQAWGYGKLSVSGRDSSAVAPKGKVFYTNRDKGLSIIFEWLACGWTSLDSSTATITISGKRSSTLVGTNVSVGTVYAFKETPWNQVLVGKASADPWKFEIREK